MLTSTAPVAVPIVYESQYRPVLPQTAICFGFVLIIQMGMILLVSFFLAEVVRVTVGGLQKTDTSPKVTGKRAQLIAQWAFVVFILLGCMVSWLMYRDVYFP